MNKNLIAYIFGLFLLSSPLLNSVAKTQVSDSVLFKHAVNLTEQGRWSDAAILFKDIASRNPTWPEPKNNLAIALFKLGKIEKAQQALEDAVISLPSFKVAQSNRKKLYDHAAAMAYYKAVGVSEKPKRPQLKILTDVKKEPEIQLPALTSAGAIGKPANAPIINNINKRVIYWSNVWSDADVEQYLSLYSNDFTPSDPGKDYTQWRIMRRAKFQFSSKPTVKLSEIQVYLSGNNRQALVEFMQDYKSAKYRDRVLKQLRLIYENDRWLILSEQVLKQVN
jgi:tetratricopeptide (TPR) repeat protein